MDQLQNIDDANSFIVSEDDINRSYLDIDSFIFSKSNQLIPSRQIRKAIIMFTWPCITELFLVSLISMVNMIMVGHLGAYAISAVGISSQPVFISIAFFEAFNIGATALVSRHIGANDLKGIKDIAIQALIIAVVFGIIIGMFCFYFSHWIVKVMGAQDDTIRFADLYMKYMGIGMVFQSIPTAVASLLRGVGETKAPMVFNIISNIINVIFGYFLIYGFLFIPPLGIEGAAISATIAKFCACVISIYLLFNNNTPVALSIKDKFRFNPENIKRIMALGYGAASEQFVLRAGVLFFTKIVADLGTLSFAAHQIGINILGISINIGLALGMAATSYLGRSLGAQMPELAEVFGKQIRRIGLVASICSSILLIFLGGPIASLYTSDMTVIAMSALILKIFALIMPFQTSQLIIAGGLRGAGDTYWPLISTIVGVLGVRIILCILFVRIFNWGLPGAWLAIILDQLVRSIVIYLRFKSGKWKNIVI